MKETKSNWECVTQEFMQETPEMHLGRYASHWFFKTPRKVLHSMSYYKFAAKMIGPHKRVLDVGCNEGLGTFLVGKECGFAKGFDFDKNAIERAQKNFSEPFVAFEMGDFLENSEEEKWDAIINFDVIEYIMPQRASDFLAGIAGQLTPEGIAIIGTPSKISQEFASEVSKKGHVNIYSHDRLEEEMRKHFECVFMFSANDEVIHTGYLPLAHYFITLGCMKK
ncbi:MAG: class I SAM-dependent methyltransferase [Simkaniaceae bacterium]|nr:class I SAM-dependent methyltransferase [Simkaniaceae bacterium]